MKVLAFLPCLRTFLGLTVKSNFRNSLRFTYFLSKNEKPFKKTFLGKLIKNDETFCRGSFSRFLVSLFYKETLYKNQSESQENEKNEFNPILHREGLILPCQSFSFNIEKQWQTFSLP